MSGIWIVLNLSLWAAVMILVFCVFTLARQVGLLHARLGPAGARMTNAGPEVGAVAPEYSALDIAGRTINIGFDSDKNWLLVFMSPSCGSCAGLIPALKSIRRSDQRRFNIVLIGLHGSDAENRSFVEKHHLKLIPYIVSESMGRTYNVISAPYAIVLDSQRVVLAKGIVNHMDHLESLLNAAEFKKPSMETWASEQAKPSADLVLSSSEVS